MITISQKSILDIELAAVYLYVGGIPYTDCGGRGDSFRSAFLCIWSDVCQLFFKPRDGLQLVRVIGQDCIIRPVHIIIALFSCLVKFSGYPPIVVRNHNCYCRFVRPVLLTRGLCEMRPLDHEKTQSLCSIYIISPIVTNCHLSFHI